MTRRLLVGVAVACALAGSAGARWAQAQAPITATPLPPPTGAEPSTPPLPGTPGIPRSSAPPNMWIPRQAAVLQALDKVNARSRTLTVKPGESVPFETLTIAVRSCLVRPPDQPADAAAFVSVTDSLPGAAPFNGWILQSAPAASMLEHPIYDLRVVGCASA